jgi:AraC-like DNA-binding protein
MASSVVTRPKAVRVTLEGFDPGEMIDVVQGGTIDHAQLTPGHFTGDVLHVSAPRINVDWGRYNLPLLFEGAFPAEYVTLAFILNEDGLSRFNGEAVAPWSMLVFSEGHELVGSVPPSLHWVSVQVTRETLAGLGWALPVNGFRSMKLDARAAGLLKGSLLPALELLDRSSSRRDNFDPRRPSLALAQLEDAALQAIDGTESADPRRTRVVSAHRISHPYRLARSAADYMRARLPQPLTIAEICTANGCTYKSLERAFLGAYSVTPKEYLTVLRLCKLREQLLRRSDCARLTDAYLSCGLTHFGRSSAAYRTLFGELPSSTAARSAR